MTDLADAFSLAPPGIAPKKWARLEAFLGTLPPAAALRLFTALESGGATGLPAAAMLAVIRTRLVESGAKLPPRRRSAARLFFAPFEDFFIQRRRGRKRRARIDRASLAPIWALVAGDAALEEAGRTAAALEAAIARGERDCAALEAALLAQAGEGFSRLIAHAEEDAAFRADLSARLAPDAQGGAAALLDLAELCRLMPLAPDLAAVQRAFVRGAGALSEEDLFEARRLYAQAADVHQDAAAYVLLAIAARMEAPWRALRLYYHLAGAEDDQTPHARADAGLIAETLLEDLESLARGLERDCDEDDAAIDDMPARLAHFADFAAGLIAEAERADDRALVNRAEASRDVAASALSRLSEQAIAAIRRAHPVRHAGGSSRLRALRPDIDRPLDRHAERAARAGAAFLARAEGLAGRLDREGAAAGFVEDAIAETRRYAGDLIAEIRAAEGPERVAARKRMDATLRAAETLLAASEIALLAERAAAAAVSA